MLGGGVLQEARLHRNTHRRQGNAVFLAEVSDGLHLGVAADQVVGEVAQRGHGLDVLSALGAVPDGQQRADSGTGDVHRAREQGVVDRGAARQLRPVDLDVDALRLAVLLDQVLIAHHVEQQVNNAELFGNADFPFGLGRGRCYQTAGEQAGTQADTGRQAAD
ncbi:hypothetical protein D3C80_1435310 [compost metagenome]